MHVGDDDRHYSGNQGYTDTFGHTYHFDSTVSNHGTVAVGDLVVLRDNKYALGLAWVQAIETSPAVKNRRGCVSCGSPRIQKRRVATPSFRCQHCGSQFDVPDEETVFVKQYFAHYSDTFIPVDGVVRTKELDPLYESHAKQQAIRRMNLPALWRFAIDRLSLPDVLLQMSPTAKTAVTAGFRAGVGPLRLRERHVRAKLMEANGSSCAVTGPQPAAALEVAPLDIPPTAAASTTSGLLLRRDLHAFFGRLQIAVDPSTWRTWVAPALMSRPELAVLHNTPLTLAPNLRPSSAGTQKHFDLATAGLGWRAR
jgi:hypothetical protein